MDNTFASPYNQRPLDFGADFPGVCHLSDSDGTDQPVGLKNCKVAGEERKCDLCFLPGTGK
ncbi:MAG: hypothetical protein MR646_07045 [Agathobacter sp.]|nr:hypothetical protein [Agathobacter sp.]